MNFSFWRTAPSSPQERSTGSLDLLARLTADPGGGVVTRQSRIVRVEGQAKSWAYAASVKIADHGTATITGEMRLVSGRMFAAVLSRDESHFLKTWSIPHTRSFVPFRLPVADVDNLSRLVFHSDANCDERPVLELRALGLEDARHAGADDGPPVDPVVEDLWPLETWIYNLKSMRRWSRDDLNDHLSGDPWKDNLILNKWEFATGAAKLESYPWRFSVPFVLCNARCEFCSAWLVQGEAMPVDILDRLGVVLPYLAQIDMVGWGEPLIHPEFGTILEKLKAGADRRAIISLTTNGWHLDKWVDRLLEANVSGFAISLHAATPKTHEDLMGLPPGSFDRVLDGVRKLVAAGKRSTLVSLVFIVTRQNLAEIPEFVKLAESLGAYKVFFRTLKARTAEEQTNDGLDYHRLPPYLHPQFDELRERAIQAIASASILIEAFPESWSTPVFPPAVETQFLAAPITPREVRLKSKSYRRKPIADTEALPLGEALEDPGSGEFPEVVENPYNRTTPMSCPSPYTAFYINGFDRQVSPCCYMTTIPGHQPVYLRKNATFDDVWNSPAMMALRTSLHDGPLKRPCLKCAFYW